METTTATKWSEQALTYTEGHGDYSDSSTINIDVTHNAPWLYLATKRLLDILLATLAIIVLIPVFIVIAVCIKLEDGGSILYFRERIGLRGRRFDIIKFRTMIPNAEAYLDQHPELKAEYQKNMKLEHDPRITRIGGFLRRAYLDELPQLFNVLFGHLSFVGPRAIHDFEVPLYGEYVEKRHTVKPGLTGLWQISPDKYRSYEVRLPLDMHYIDHRSFFLDLTILFKTPRALIVSKGV